jgi:hypothetical protein
VPERTAKPESAAQDRLRGLQPWPLPPHADVAPHIAGVGGSLRDVQALAGHASLDTLSRRRGSAKSRRADRISIRLVSLLIAVSLAAVVVLL